MADHTAESIKVFPVYAGMNRTNETMKTDEARVPRVRGDEPAFAVVGATVRKCSPCTRG